MSQIELFNKLVQDAQRDDGYINATKWCKHFEYDLSNWKRLPETKARLTALSDNVTITGSSSEVNSAKITQSTLDPWIVERVGNTWVTWVHPIMAVHLAGYLDPAFANYVAEIFVRYITADPNLAADIASRQETTEGLDIIDKSVQGRYEFLKSKLARAYYIIRDAWGDKLHYNTLTEEIQLNGSTLELEFLKIKIEQELNVKIAIQDATQIVKALAIVNTYPSMDAVNQQIFGNKYRFHLEIRNLVPTKDSPSQTISYDQ